MMLIFAAMTQMAVMAAGPYDNPDTLVVARDGTGQFRTVSEAVEVCRAFMEYHKVILVKSGTYKEKVVIPSWLDNIEILGEDVNTTVITYDDHANIRLESIGKGMGTFRTYTVKVEGNDITLKNITIENNSARLGQAVALHTEGDRLKVVGCRLLGHQDTVYTGKAGTRIYFAGCYIEGTTDFIFGTSIAYFENCEIRSKKDSYITAASTLEGQKYGYVFYRCKLTADEGVTQCYLGRPWGAYAKTVFIECELGSHILPEGWHDWEKDGKPDTKKNSFYGEWGNTGPGAVGARVKWAHKIKPQDYTFDKVMFQTQDNIVWDPYNNK